MTTTDLLAVLEDLLCVAYGPDETAVARIGAAEQWMGVLRAARCGRPHYEPLADPVLVAHEEEHQINVGGVLVGKFDMSRRIAPTDKFPAWAGRAPAGWKPRASR